NLARYAGAERDAPNELRTAEADLQQAESAWRMHQPEREIDILARQAISSGAKAEDMALARRVARERREEIERRDLAVRAAEENTATANQENTRLKRELENERHARELAERDSLNATEQLRDARTEIARLRAEMQTVRADAEDRSEEHTSELQSPDHLVCRLLLEKKKRHDEALERNIHAAHSIGEPGGSA